MTTARDLMSSPVDSLFESNSLIDAAAALARADVGSMPVTGEDGGLVGVLTDRDIVVRAIAEGKDPSECTVGDIMTSDVATVSPDANEEQVLECLSSNQIRRVPVIENGKLVGVISQADVARELSAKDTGDVVEAISRH
ncbi:MAG: CBS domain-containing protein [Actinomycetia bacterium]|nr:CBS domain-containing protein [Actinomycetes bacterium]